MPSLGISSIQVSCAHEKGIVTFKIGLATFCVTNTGRQAGSWDHGYAHRGDGAYDGTRR